MAQLQSQHEVFCVMDLVYMASLLYLQLVWQSTQGELHNPTPIFCQEVWHAAVEVE